MASASILQIAIPFTASPVYPQHKPYFRVLVKYAKEKWVLHKHGVCVSARPLACDSRVRHVYFYFLSFSFFLSALSVRNLPILLDFFFNKEMTNHQFRLKVHT